MSLYQIFNGPMPTSAAFVGVTTGTALKTMLQAKMGANFNGIAKIREWGISFKGFAAAEPVRCELLATGAIGATITEFVAADIINIGDPNAGAVTDDFPLAFTAAGDESGYTATAEGSVVVTRPFDLQYVAPSNQYVKQFPLGAEPCFKAAEFCRIRVHSPASVDCICYMILDI